MIAAKKTIAFLGLTLLTMSAFAAPPSHVTDQYPVKSTLNIDLTYKGAITYNVQIQNGHFDTALPHIIPSDATVPVVTTADNDDYSLSFTINHLPLGSCAVTFYTPLGTDKHPLYTAVGDGCLNLNIDWNPYTHVFYINSN